mmetsp:Transcript_57022/g.77771  ORF Transcript_57022/g.77771 Transcript_57022/m.77771 type:complete len:100 (-) Transcript_57022:62-361(-)
MNRPYTAIERELVGYLGMQGWNRFLEKSCRLRVRACLVTVRLMACTHPELRAVAAAVKAVVQPRMDGVVVAAAAAGRGAAHLVGVGGQGCWEGVAPGGR